MGLWTSAYELIAYMNYDLYINQRKIKKYMSEQLCSPIFSFNVQYWFNNILCYKFFLVISVMYYVLYNIFFIIIFQLYSFPFILFSLPFWCHSACHLSAVQKLKLHEIKLSYPQDTSIWLSSFQHGHLIRQGE